jgi:hypothetical protein
MLGDSPGASAASRCCSSSSTCARCSRSRCIPADDRKDLLPAGETGKTEAWVVLEAGPKSRIYAGLKPGPRADDLRRAVASGVVADNVASFVPKPGDGVLVPAGTVHSLGDVVVFEIQENSDVTFRLDDWGHVDPKTGRPRALQVDEAMSAIDVSQGAVKPVSPVLEELSRLSASGFSIASTSGCGACAANRPLPSAPRARRAYWSASRRHGPGRARRRVLRRRQGGRRVASGGGRSLQSSGRAARSPCWKQLCRNEEADRLRPRRHARPEQVRARCRNGGVAP